MSRQKFTAFIKTIELGSITKAATYLGYTQSAVSRMIADLEEEWGLTLLTRSRAGVSISSDGLTLLPLLRSICARSSESSGTVKTIPVITGNGCRDIWINWERSHSAS